MTNAPKVTEADIEAAIRLEYYITGEQLTRYTTPVLGPAGPLLNDVSGLNCLTLCVLVLRNGFTVTGESACVSPGNFDETLGRQIARKSAIAKVWPLLGYALKDLEFRLQRAEKATND